MFPESINIGFRFISTILLVSIMGVVCWGFVLWYEAKKDGFNPDRFFDLIFSSLIISGLSFYGVFKLIEWLKIFRPANPILYLDKNVLLAITTFLVSLLPIFYFAKKLKWSVFRIVDIYSMAFCLLIMFVSMGEFLVYGHQECLVLFILTLALYTGVMRYRGYRFMSGAVFSIFLLFIALSLSTYFRKNGYLLFAPIMVTISVVNLYLRGKKTMAKTIFPDHFISRLKNKLLSKEKKLVEEQQALIRDDPYLQQGRETDNSETMDDVLEDTGKTITDARLGIVRGAKVQVRKALAAIKLGRYGKCEVCGREIDKARLEAYPEATTCIDCATDSSQVEDVREDEMLEESL